MSDYKSMYLKLFNSVTDAIEVLHKAQEEVEEMYINASEKELLRKIKIANKEKED